MRENKTIVIEGPKYAAEEEALKADPIIQRMAREVTMANVVTGKPVDLNSHEFMSSALRTYQHRGGTQAASIGGPARAIRVLLQTEKP